MRSLLLALIVVLAPVQASAFEFNMDDLGKLVDAGSSLIKSYEDLTPEQEYYLGRAVTARLLKRFKTVKMPKTHAYLQSIINYLVQFSSRPETYGGYHVQIRHDDPQPRFLDLCTCREHRKNFRLLMLQ